MSDHTWDLVGQEQILVIQCLMTDCYLQPGTHLYRAVSKNIYTVFLKAGH